MFHWLVEEELINEILEHALIEFTAGTICHKSKTPLTKWFLAILLVANDKRGIAATTLSQMIGVSYPTAWLMLHKIRLATDGFSSYEASAREIYAIHVVQPTKEDEAHQAFYWVDTIISNLKKFINGTYHGRQTDIKQHFINSIKGLDGLFDVFWRLSSLWYSVYYENDEDDPTPEVVKKHEDYLKSME